MGLKFKISFCTVSMNRLKHIRYTLLKNIQDNDAYQNLEFILLDYNSKDRLDQFVKDNLNDFILSGKLVYYKTTNPIYFNRSHSRNLMMKLASGDIICNIDADNYTGKGFAEYINNIFQANNNAFISTAGFASKQDVLGRICMFKNDFLKVGGFDERMVYYGFEDYDIINSLQLLGIKKIGIQDQEFLQVIEHSNSERVANEFVHNNLCKVMISYISPSMSKLCFLFTNGSFAFGSLVDNVTADNLHPKSGIYKEDSRYKYSIAEAEWINGTWYEDGATINAVSNVTKFSFEEVNNAAMRFYNEITYGLKYFQIVDQEMIEDAIYFYSQISNRIIMEKNMLEKIATVNTEGFGKEVVYKNLDTLKAVEVR